MNERTNEFIETIINSEVAAKPCPISVVVVVVVVVGGGGGGGCGGGRCRFRFSSRRNVRGQFLFSFAYWSFFSVSLRVNGQLRFYFLVFDRL